MSDVNRRELLAALAAAPAAFMITREEAAHAAAQTTPPAAGQPPYVPRFFTPQEYATVVVLGDMIIPRDARSGSASDAGVPAFIDYIVAEQPVRQTPMRGGLVWIDSECRSRFDRTFVECPDDQRRQLLDDIAWPRRAKSELSHGVAFFTALRDLVAAGFWSSRMGVDDLGYLGNRPVGEWTGAPPEVLQKLGVAYDSNS